MNIRIKSMFGAVLFEGVFSSLSEAVVAAVKAGANLSRANLSGADLSRANLSGANLSGANLFRANLSGADLSGANLSRANLSGANLSGADLSGANLSGADLSGAYLFGADLSGAYLSGADLSRANLSGANLSGADLSDEQKIQLYARRTILPEGDLIGYKKLRDGTIAKLRIPADARRVGGFVGRKCRAEYAVVLSGSGYSQHDSCFEYVEGKEVRPRHPFDPEVADECRSGIHFFITRQEAEEYDL